MRVASGFWIFCHDFLRGDGERVIRISKVVDVSLGDLAVKMLIESLERRLSTVRVPIAI